MKRPQALVCAPAVADPDRQSGSRRTTDLIEFLLEDGWLVTFAGSDAGRERYARALRQKGVRTVSRAEEQLEELLDAHQFDLALIAFWHIAERYIPVIRRASPATRIAVDSIDLHFLRAARGAFLDGGGATALGQEEGEMFVRELNAYSAADAVLTVSRKEAASIDDLLARPGHAITVPDCEEGERSPMKFTERSGILFVGNFAHPPNVGAVEFLCQEIAPRISADILDRHPISVVGSSLDRRIRRLCERQAGVNPVGWVPSVQQYLNSARVSVVPLLYGAGTKRKLIQALRAGTPAVSTTVGVEGLGVTPGRELLVADDAGSFAASVERLVEDEALWSRLADAGWEHIARTHSRTSVHARFKDALDEILKRESSASTSRAAATSVRERAPLPPRPERARPRQSPHPELPRPIFIIGAPRSGTSVLTWALGQHPNLLPLEESDWLAKLGVDAATSHLLATSRGDRSALAAMGISRGSLYSALGRAVDELIRTHRRRYEELTTIAGGARQPSSAYRVARSLDDPKGRWVDGTPEYSHSVVALRRLFPGALFIHIVRDVRDVARSLVHFHTIGGRVFTWQDAYAKWLKNVEACVEAEKAFGSAIVLRVRYADLVSGPERVVRRCLTFVGEDYCADCLEPLSTKINSSRVPSGVEVPADEIEPSIRKEAEGLSAELLSQELVSHGPAPQRQQVLECAYDKRIPSLDRFFSKFVASVARSATNGTSDPGRDQSIMKREWDERARVNAMHYVASNKVVWEEDDFYASGAADVERHVTSDLDGLCGGRTPRGMTVLEIGCGVGRMTRHLASVFGEVHGVDVSPTMVATGRTKLANLTNVHLHETGGSDLSMFADGFFDLAFSYIVFQHIPFREAIISYFREVHRTLKRGCIFKFQVQGASIERPNTWVGIGFSSEDMKMCAEQVGFERLKETGAGTQYYWHWWRRAP